MENHWQTPKAPPAHGPVLLDSTKLNETTRTSGLSHHGKSFAKRQTSDARRDPSHNTHVVPGAKQVRTSEGSNELLSRVFRGALARIRLRRLHRSIAVLQAHFRQSVWRKRFKSLQRWRIPWKHYLVPNEAVLFSSLVATAKDSSLFGSLFHAKKKSQLILTTRFRLLLVNVATTECTQVLHRWNPAIDRITISGASDTSEEFTLQFHSNGKLQSLRLRDLVTCAQDWQNVLTLQLNSNHETSSLKNNTRRDSTRSINQDPIWSATMIVLSSFDRAGFLFTSRTPISLQGPLVKRAIVSKTNWRERWCVLRGSILLWFKGCERKGALMLSEDSIITKCKDSKRSNTFEISFKTSSGEHRVLRVQAKSAELAKVWMKHLTREVSRMSSAGNQTSLPFVFEDDDELDQSDDEEIEEPKHSKKSISVKANVLYRKLKTVGNETQNSVVTFANPLVESAYKELEQNGSVDKLAGRLVVKAKSKQVAIMDNFDPEGKQDMLDLIQVAQMYEIASAVLGIDTNHIAKFDNAKKVDEYDSHENAQVVSSSIKPDESCHGNTSELGPETDDNETSAGSSVGDSASNSPSTIGSSDFDDTNSNNTCPAEGTESSDKTFEQELQRKIIAEFTRKREGVRPPNPGVTGRGMVHTQSNNDELFQSSNVNNDIVITRASIPPSSRRRRPRMSRQFKDLATLNESVK